jgi:hypothetical protein
LILFRIVIEEKLNNIKNIIGIRIVKIIDNFFLLLAKKLINDKLNITDIHAAREAFQTKQRNNKIRFTKHMDLSHLLSEKIKMKKLKGVK